MKGRYNSESGRKYRETHVNQIRERIKRWHDNHIEQVKEYQKLWRAKNRQKTIEYQREWKKKVKLNAFTHYGGNPPHCNCCGETILDFLSINHMEGRKSWNHSKKVVGTWLYKWLIDNSYPKGFEVLCMNCNHAKGKYGGSGRCPHEQINEKS